jgi:hypothetical protein
MVSDVFCLICIEVWTARRKFGRLSLSQRKFEGFVMNNVADGGRQPAGSSVGLIARLRTEEWKDCEFHSHQDQDSSCSNCPHGFWALLGALSTSYMLEICPYRNIPGGAEVPVSSDFLLLCISRLSIFIL